MPKQPMHEWFSNCARHAKLFAMCGRFVLKTSLAELQQYFGIQRLKYTPEPSFNIAPTQTVAAVVENTNGTRGLVGLKWGLIPPWSADESVATKMINARSETLHEKPSFRDAFHHQRCLILADGFFEWKKGQKTPFFIYDHDRKPLAFAGIYSFWKRPQDGERLATCAIVTTAANAKIEALHHRMPVILSAEAQRQWLRKDLSDTGPLLDLLKPYPAEQTAFHPVNPAINKVQENRPENLDRYNAEPPTGPQQTALFEQLFDQPLD